jgi:hypothetical protein
MSRHLPARPNLEHLRKQARERLRALCTHDSRVRLADAQHMLAREYGFASWPKLAAHVKRLTASAEAAPDTPPPAVPGPGAPPSYGFERYSERARRATFFSRWEAAQLGSPVIECEHLLLGIIHARQDLARAVAPRFAPPVAEIRATVTNAAVVNHALPTSVIIPFSSATIAALGRAAEIARSLAHEQITTGHLLAGLAQSAPSTVAGALEGHEAHLRTLLNDADALSADA